MIGSSFFFLSGWRVSRAGRGGVVEKGKGWDFLTLHSSAGHCDHRSFNLRPQMAETVKNTPIFFLFYLKFQVGLTPGRRAWAGGYYIRTAGVIVSEGQTME